MELPIFEPTMLKIEDYLEKDLIRHSTRLDTHYTKVGGLSKKIQRGHNQAAKMNHKAKALRNLKSEQQHHDQNKESGSYGQF